MSVRHNNTNNRFVIDYYPTGAKGRRARITLPAGTTERDAVDLERSLRAQRTSVSILNVNGSISKLAPAYYDHTALHLAPSTQRDIKNCFTNHIIPFFGSFHVEELTTPLISAYQKARRNKPAMRGRIPRAINRTINKELSYFSAFLSWIARENGSMPITPLAFRALPYRRPLPDVLSPDDASAIIAETEDHYKGIIMALSHLGLRITSARMLKWENIDLERKTVSVITKGGRELKLPLPDDLHAWLQRKASENQFNSPWAFPSRHSPSRPIVDARKAIGRAVTRAGISKAVHPHLFRHSAAAHLLSSGVDVRIVQEILGHTDIRMTQWYTQVLMGTKTEALQKAGHIVKSSQSKNRKKNRKRINP